MATPATHEPLGKQPGIKALRTHVRCLQEAPGRPGTSTAAGTLSLDYPPLLAWADGPHTTTAHVLSFPQPGERPSAQQQAAVEALCSAAAAAGGMLPAERISLLHLPGAAAAAAPGGQLPGGPTVLEEIRRSMVPDGIAVNTRLQGLCVQTQASHPALDLPPPLPRTAEDSTGQERHQGHLLVVLPWPHCGGGGTLVARPPPLRRPPPRRLPAKDTKQQQQQDQQQQQQQEEEQEEKEQEEEEEEKEQQEEEEEKEQQEEEEEKEQQEEEETIFMAAAGNDNLTSVAEIPGGSGEVAAQEEKGKAKAADEGPITRSKRRRLDEQQRAAAAAAAAARLSALQLPWFAFGERISLTEGTPVSEGARLTLVYDLGSIEPPRLPPERWRGHFTSSRSGEDESSSSCSNDFKLSKMLKEEEEALLRDPSAPHAPARASLGPTWPPCKRMAAAAAASPLAGRLRQLLGCAAWHPMGATLGLMCDATGGIAAFLRRTSKRGVSNNVFPEVLTGAPRLLWTAAAAAGLRLRAVMALLAPSAASTAAWGAFAEEAREKHGCSSRRPPWHADWLRVDAESGGPAAAASLGAAAAGEAAHEVPPCSVLLLPDGYGRLSQAKRVAKVLKKWSDWDGPGLESHEKARMMGASPAESPANDAALMRLVGGARRATDAAAAGPVLWLAPLRDSGFVGVGAVKCLSPPGFESSEEYWEDDSDTEEWWEMDEQGNSVTILGDRKTYFMQHRSHQGEFLFFGEGSCRKRSRCGWFMPLRAGVAVLVDVPAWGSEQRAAAIGAAADR